MKRYRAITVLCIPSLISLISLDAQDIVTCPSIFGTSVNRLIVSTKKVTFNNGRTPKAVTVTLPRANFIDTYLFGQMEKDGVPPAALSTDPEFIRRVTLDLTGRIPTLEVAEAFLASTQKDKRARLIDTLLTSSAFIDHWTFHFAERVGLTTTYYISSVDRNAAQRKLKEWITLDIPLNRMATEMITASGDPLENPAVVFPLLAADYAGVVQDFWDTQTDRVTTQWLGIKMDCISCHNGRGHLEKINLDLTRRTRQDFWKLAAFMSRTRFEPIFNEAAGVSSIPRALLLDQVTGSYNGAVPPSSPGVRPLRTISDLPPTYLFTGEEPGLPNWRAEFARLVTTDRQFARAQVNYLWAYLFRNGIVDPPNDWDLMRTDGTQELPPGWAPQNIHPGLLEELADEFIQSGYSLRKSLRLLTNSTVYQLSSSYPTGMWRSGYEDYFAKSNPRRLSAEELVDAVAVATDTVQPIQLNGMTEPIYFAEQLPDSNEPSNSPAMGQLLDRLGRGKRTDTSPRVVRPELLGLLSYQNTAELVARTQASSQGDLLNRATRLAALGLTDEEIVRRLFIATLSRYPTPDEINVVLARRGNNRLQWLSDLQWVLVQKLEFIFLQ